MSGLLRPYTRKLRPFHHTSLLQTTIRTTPGRDSAAPPPTGLTQTTPGCWPSSPTVRGYCAPCMLLPSWMPFPKGLHQDFADSPAQVPRLPSAPGHKRPMDRSVSSDRAGAPLGFDEEPQSSLLASHLPFFWVQDPNITLGTTLFHSQPLQFWLPRLQVWH